MRFRHSSSARVIMSAWSAASTVLKNLGISIDVIAGSVTDSQMGEDFVEQSYNLNAGNARRDGRRLYQLIENNIHKARFENLVAV